MFIRAKTVQGRTYYQVVKGERRDGKVHQVVVLALGPHATLEEASEAAEARLEEYKGYRDAAERVGSSKAVERYANLIAKTEDFINRLAEVWSEMDKASATTQERVVPKQEEWERLRDESRRRADWPEPERYVYWRQGKGKAASWQAHRIITEINGLILFPRYGCRLRAIGTKDDPYVKYTLLGLGEMLHAIPLVLFNTPDGGHGVTSTDRVFLNCDAVRAAYAEDLTRVNEDPWEQAQRFWDEHFGEGNGSGPIGDAKRTAEAATLLGVVWPCTAAELRQAKHKRSKAVHPDVGGSTEEMAKVNAAYDWLAKLVS